MYGLRRAPCVALAPFLIALLAPERAQAQCSGLKNPDSSVTGSEIRYVAGSPEVSSALLNDAVQAWNTGCPGQFGEDFPTLLAGGSGGLTYTVAFGGHNSSDGDCGRFSGLTIMLFSSSTESGQRKDCGNLTMNLAHEIGHTLGLADAPTGSQCQHHIMSWINRDNLYSRSVQPEECEKVDQRWSMPGETGGGAGGPITITPCV